jgi:hypothetical protein
VLFIVSPLFGHLWFPLTACWGDSLRPAAPGVNAVPTRFARAGGERVRKLRAAEVGIALIAPRRLLRQFLRDLG